MAVAARSSHTQPTWEFGVSLALHGLLVAVAVLATRCGGEDPTPLIDPSEVMIVEMAGPAKQTTAMPQRAERAPDPIAGAPEPTAEAPPPPVQSDMSFKTPDAPTQKGDPSADARREQILADLKRKQLLSNLDAPVGTEDRAATSPDGAGDATGPVGAGTNDPELAKWIAAARRAVGDNWHPLTATCMQNPDLQVLVRVEVDANGRKSGAPQVAKSSGNTSFDAAGVRAVEMTGALPPPPARFAATNGLTATLKFTARECR
jgi:TonB family protein